MNEHHTGPAVRLITFGEAGDLACINVAQGQITCHALANPSSSEFHAKCPLPIAQQLG
jgi:hypothetical protein